MFAGIAQDAPNMLWIYLRHEVNKKNLYLVKVKRKDIYSLPDFIKDKMPDDVF